METIEGAPGPRERQFRLTCLRPTGEVAERLNAPVSKTGMGLSVHRGFESPPLRSVMSRDIGLTCLGTSVSVRGGWPAAGFGVLVAPVGLLRIDQVDGEDLA